MEGWFVSHQKLLELLCFWLLITTSEPESEVLQHRFILCTKCQYVVRFHGSWTGDKIGSLRQNRVGRCPGAWPSWTGASEAGGSGMAVGGGDESEVGRSAEAMAVREVGCWTGVNTGSRSADNWAGGCSYLSLALGGVMMNKGVRCSLKT